MSLAHHQPAAELKKLFQLKGAETWPWPNNGMIYAGIRSSLIYPASSSYGIEIETVVIGKSYQGENFIFKIEVFNHPLIF